MYGMCHESHHAYLSQTREYMGAVFICGGAEDKGNKLYSWLGVKERKEALLMITKTIKTVAEYVAGLGLDVTKETFKKNWMRRNYVLT